MLNIQEIIDQWCKVREVSKDVIRIHELSHANPWNYEIKRSLEEAFNLDPEGLTALLLLDNYRHDFFACCGLSLQEILENKNVRSYMEDCLRLTEMLSDEEILDALNTFVGSVTNATKHMDVDREDVTGMLQNRYEMAILRRDALRSMETLSLHQFFQGDTAMDHLTFLPDIHVFWNMNSLIRCAWQSPNGVSINLIKDPLDTSSYFAFVAKNGGNLTILTDKPKEAHPLSKYMSRRPERSFTDRVFRNHFPYGLMNLTFDYKGYAHPGTTSLVPLQEKPIKIGSIAEMEPDEIIWTIMMFSLIDAKLYKENYHCGELSYTSDMIADPNIGASLIAQGKGGALMVRDYKPLVAPVLTTESTENDPQYSRYSGSGQHLWLYERYKDQVPSDLLNGLLPSDESVLFLLPSGNTFLAPKDRVEQQWYDKRPILKEDPKNILSTKLEGGGTMYLGPTTIKDAVPLKKMTGDEFGSAESLIRDYTWYARYNAAEFIKKKAKDEFEARKDEVFSWVKSRIEQNLERISKDILREILSKEKTEHPCDFYMTELKGDWHEHMSPRGTIVFVKDRKAAFRRPGSCISPLWNNADAGCWFSEDAPCSYLIKARAIEMEDLLYLTGCESAEELPDVLRHWHNSDYGSAGMYRGNHILDRIDPMDWVVSSPWDELRFSPLIGIGKKYLSKVKKELGIQ